MKGSNYFKNIKMMEIIERKDECPDDDRVIYIPDEEYLCFMRSFYKMDLAQREFHKIRDNLKPNVGNSIDNQSS
jgi:hypothetical protein